MRLFTGVVTGLVGSMVFAQLARADGDWPPFALALAGMVCGWIGCLIADSKRRAMR